MTSLVAVRCTDGIVVGSDSSATFADGGGNRTIEQPTKKKLQIVGDHVVIAATGSVGHAQRFHAVVNDLWQQKQFVGKTGIQIAKMLSSAGIKDFHETHLTNFPVSVLVAYPATDGPMLCELSGGSLHFQPEMKDPSDIWYVSLGSGQAITDPFLALLRSIFWNSGPPNLQGGIFSVVWALEHACEVNPGGIKAPINVAVLASEKGKYSAKQFTDEELQEHRDMVQEATAYFGTFKDVVQGKAGGKAAAEIAEIPKPE